MVHRMHVSSSAFVVLAVLSCTSSRARVACPVVVVSLTAASSRSHLVEQCSTAIEGHARPPCPHVSVLCSHRLVGPLLAYFGTLEANG